MRVEKIERIVLTVDENKVLEELWQKINNLDIEDYDLNEIRRKLQGAIGSFLDNCSEDVD